MTGPPYAIPKPALADSLAGVVARLTGGDSTQVGKIHWQQSDARSLGNAPAREYGMGSGSLPVIARTSPDRSTITFATQHYLPWPDGTLPPPKSIADDPEMLKHELYHAETGDMGHTSPLLAALMNYRGK